MDIFKAIALGVVQGLTEFLPVSSHGHLVLFHRILPIEEQRALAFDVCLHFGTLVAVLVYFRQDLIAMASAAIGGPVEDGESYLRRWWWLLGVATVPVGIAGILFAEDIESSQTSTLALGLSFLATAALLAYGAARLNAKGRGPFQLGMRDAIVVGVFQAFALIPAVSRSGTTIVGGIVSGLDASTAARFSFLLSIPAITAAIIGNLPGVRLLLAEDPAAVAAGTLTAAVTGALAIELMMRVVRVGRLLPFAVYCGVLGLAVLSAGWLG